MTMKTSHLLVLTAGLALAQAQAQAQERVWRCGNEYTNNAAAAQQRGCKLVEGSNVTVVQSPRPNAPAASSAGAARAPASGARVDETSQRTRDTEARAVLEAELRKAEAQHAELLKEYNNGEPEKQGSESRNYQKYLDRVAEMKTQIARNESDIAGIRRELDRLPPAKP